MSYIRPYGSGKFNTMMDSAVHHLAMVGTDEELSGMGFGWAGLIRLTPGETLLQPDPSGELGGVWLNADEREFLLKHTAGCVLREDTEGSVIISYFTKVEELEDAWKGAQEDYAAFAADDDQMAGESDAPV